MRARALATLGLAAATLVAVGVPLLLRTGRRPAASAAAPGVSLSERDQGVALRPATRDSLGELPMMVATPAEVRAVVHACRGATRADVAGLRRRALDSPDPLVAGNALRALGRLAALRGDAELMMLQDDERARVRQEAVVALGLDGDDAAVEHLERILGDPDVTLRALACQALGRAGGVRAVRILEGVRDDPTRTDLERAFARAALRAGEGRALGFPRAAPRGVRVPQRRSVTKPSPAASTRE